METLILNAKISNLERFFTQSGLSGMPDSYRAIVGHPERLPEGESDLMTDPSGIIAYNLQLRKEGWLSNPGWPVKFLAIGQDPGGSILFFNGTEPGEGVWFADKELCYTSEDVIECAGMEEIAESFGDYVSDIWNLYLKRQSEMPDEALDRSHEFDLLREYPHPLLLENYYEESATRYEAYEAWKREGGDYQLFFRMGNLKSETAHQLLAPAVEIAARQKSYGRFRAAIGMLQRLLNTSRAITLPDGCEKGARRILEKGRELELEGVDSWDAVRPVLERSAD